MAKSKLSSPIKSFKESDNRLLIIDFGSLSYHQLYAINSSKKYGNVVIESAYDEKIAWKKSIIREVLDYIVLFNPLDVVIALEGDKTWRNDIYKEYYSKHTKITYDSTGYFVAYDNDVIHIYKSGDVITSVKLKDKSVTPVKEIAYEKLSSAIKDIVDKILPRYKENRAKKPWEFLMSKKEFADLRNDFARDISKIIRAKAVEVKEAEGDDIIYTSCDIYKNKYESIVLVTRDSDMNQLLTINNLTIYNHLTKELTECNNPREYLEIKILAGDTSDAIPGILIPGRKLKLAEAGAISFFEALGDKSCYEAAKEQGWLDQYNRNSTLINLTLIPATVKNSIISQLEEQDPKFCPFWELSSMEICTQHLEEISKIKELGYYTLNKKDDLNVLYSNFKKNSNYIRAVRKSDDSKVVSRIKDSSEYTIGSADSISEFGSYF